MLAEIKAYSNLAGNKETVKATNNNNTNINNNFKMQLDNAIKSFQTGITQSTNIVQSTNEMSKFISSSLGNAFDSLRKNETVSKKAIFKKADITDLISASTEAEIALNQIIAVRDKVISAYMDIIKMTI